MTYHCSYRTNPIFPYTNQQNPQKSKGDCKNSSSKHISPQKEDTSCSFSKEDSLSGSPRNVNNVFSGLLDSILKPIEKLIGRKIKFDDFLLVVLIYLLFTEKDNEDNTLLFCLLFILFS
jgi:hypothetical protein